VDGRDRAGLAAAAWFRTTSGDAAHAVGSLMPNPLGLHDLLGNVWEWCQDGYAPYPADGSTDHLGIGSRRVLRGGGWGDPAEHLRAANRAALDPTVASAQIGCRIVIVEEAAAANPPSTNALGDD
jgi:formylglycine-generating enzyme required for sulfatase activity